jgi:hypothetical protein
MWSIAFRNSMIAVFGIGQNTEWDFCDWRLEVAGDFADQIDAAMLVMLWSNYINLPVC